MAYVAPKVEITQTFIQTPAVTTQPLPAFIIGPQFDLHRYAVAAEKAGIAAVNPNGTSGNSYIPGSNVAYPYPSQGTGTTVDTSYVTVNIDNAVAQYFPNSTLGSVASTNNVVELVQTTATSGKYYPNQVHATSGSGAIFKTGNGYNRNSYFSNRDVQIGDVVTVTDGLGNTVTSQVNAILPETVVQNSGLAATIGTKTVATTTDGVANGTTTFTSASAAFTSALVGLTITILTKGTYTIAAVTNATTLVLSGSPASGSGLSYYVGGVYNDVGNIQPQAAVINNAATYVTSSGSNSGVTISVAGTTAYYGYPALRIANDTYTATCTTGGSPAASRWSVASTAGAFATQTNLSLTSTSGTTGTLTLDTGNSNVVVWAFTISGGSFTVNSAWTVALSAAVTLVNPTAAGTYTGSTNITYKLSVTKGGPAYTGSNASTCAQLTVTSNNVDASAAVVLGSSAISVGTLGVTATFSGGSENSQYMLGDNYYITVIGPQLGAYKILQFNDSLPAATLSQLAGTTPILATLSVSQTTVAVPPVANITSGALNWIAAATTLTLNAGITTTDPNLISAGVPLGLPITSGNVFIQHRDLNPANSTSIQSVSTAAAIPGIIGTIDPANPLAQGVYDAVLNAGGQQVYFLGLQTNNLAGYNTALAISKGTNTVYGVVPLTFDVPTQQAVVAFNDGISIPQTARWRSNWLSLQAQTTGLLYNLKSDGVTPWTGTVTADPLASGTVYSLLTVAGATFITSGIRPGDSVLINFGINSQGATTYQTLTVASVRTQTTLAVTVGLGAPINSATKIQIQRNYSSAEQITNLGLAAAGYDDRRVRVVFPDTVVSGGVSMPGYFLAAALAGLRSSVLPHQGLTNYPVLGFDTLPEVDSVYTSDQLDTLASSGVFIVTQPLAGVTPYVRHQLTTNVSSVTYQEDSITSNVDSISYALQAILRPFIGIYNRNAQTLLLIKAALQAEIVYFQTQSYSATAGYQLGPNTSIVSIAFDPTFADTINVVIDLDVPGPTNYITVNLVV